MKGIFFYIDYYCLSSTHCPRIRLHEEKFTGLKAIKNVCMSLTFLMVMCYNEYDHHFGHYLLSQLFKNFCSVVFVKKSVNLWTVNNEDCFQ
jgi:hypothetical protein